MKTDVRRNEINLEDYCIRVVRQLRIAGIRLVPDQIKEIVGGFSNLYLELCILLESREIKFETSKAIISELVPYGMILREVRRCSGLKEHEASEIFKVLSGVLFSYFGSTGKTQPGSFLRFPALGTFEIIDFDSSRYFFTYTDPAVGTYGEFLLYHRSPDLTMPAQTEPVDLHHYISKLIDRAKPLAERRGQHLTFEVPALPALPINRGEFRRVLQVLIMNVLVGTPPNRQVGISVRSGYKPNSIRLVFQSSAFDPSLLNKLLDPFFTTREDMKFINSISSAPVNLFRKYEIKAALSRAVGGSKQISFEFNLISE